MITDSEIREHAERHGVPELQIRRDWVISHVLPSLASIQQQTPIVFYGGTALCRTWCPDLRLSEDIDLSAKEKESFGYPSAQKRETGGPCPSKIRQIPTISNVRHEGLEPPTPCASWTKGVFVTVR